MNRHVRDAFSRRTYSPGRDPQVLACFILVIVMVCSSHLLLFRRRRGDFPGGTMVKNPPANAGDMGSSPGRSHMPRSS